VWWESGIRQLAFLGAFGSSLRSVAVNTFNLHVVILYVYCNVLGVLYSRWNFIALQKSIHYSLTQLATLRTHVDVRPARSRNAHSYRILPTGPLVAIFQLSLPFLQSESFQTHVGTIHHQTIGPLALHNGTSAYTSLTCHFPDPTIGCLHRPP
jgi:hypothetical protein